MDRLYSLDEARATLPWLLEIGSRLRDRKEKFDRHQNALRLLAGGVRGGDSHLRPALKRHHDAAAILAAELQAMFTALSERGVECKGIEQGLFDFRSPRDGRVVYLCWQMEEPDIRWWHELDSGFAARRPLD